LGAAGFEGDVCWSSVAPLQGLGLANLMHPLLFSVSRTPIKHM